MKKAILLSTLTTILTLSLAGCGSTGGLEDSVGVQNSTAPTGPVSYTHLTLPTNREV